MASLLKFASATTIAAVIVSIALDLLGLQVLASSLSSEIGFVSIDPQKFFEIAGKSVVVEFSPETQTTGGYQYHSSIKIRSVENDTFVRELQSSASAVKGFSTA